MVGMQNKRLATLLVLATAAISGVSNFVNKIAVTAVKDPVLYTTAKNVLVALALVGVMLGAKKWGEVKNASRKQLLLLFAIGAVGGSVPFALYFTGLTMTSAVNAAFIHKTLFLWVFLFAYPFLKERMTFPQLVGVAAIFGANIFVGGFTGFAYNAGELMILCAAILWGAENVLAKKVLAGLSSNTVATARMAIGALLLTLYLLLFGGGFGAFAALHGAAWGWLALTSALLFGYVTTWYAALKRAPATYVTTLLVPSTLVTNALSAAFVTHTFGGWDLVSTILFIAGVACVIFFARRMPRGTEEIAPAASA